MKKRKYIKRGAWIPMLLGLLLFAGVAAWMVRGVREASEVSQREGLRIDYIWRSEALPVARSRVVFNGAGGPVVSDHFGVLAETEEA